MRFFFVSFRPARHVPAGSGPGGRRAPTAPDPTRRRLRRSHPIPRRSDTSLEEASSRQRSRAGPSRGAGRDGAAAAGAAGAGPARRRPGLRGGHGHQPPGPRLRGARPSRPYRAWARNQQSPEESVLIWQKPAVRGALMDTLRQRGRRCVHTHIDAVLNMKSNEMSCRAFAFLCQMLSKKKALTDSKTWVNSSLCQYL